MLVIQCSEWIRLLLNVVLGYSARGWALWADPRHEYQKWCALVRSTRAEFRIKEVLSLCRCSLGFFGFTLHVIFNCALGCFVSLQDGGLMVLRLQSSYRWGFFQNLPSHKQKVWVQFRKQRKRERTGNYKHLWERWGNNWGKKKAKSHWF